MLIDVVILEKVARCLTKSERIRIFTFIRIQSLQKTLCASHSWRKGDRSISTREI